MPAMNVTHLTNPLGNGNTPTGNSNASGWSKTGKYLVVGSSVSPFIFIYKRTAGNQLTRIPAANIIGTAIGSEVRSFNNSWTSDDSYLSVATVTSDPVVYKNNGDDTFTRLTIPFTSSSSYQTVFSPDNKYLFMAAGASSPYLAALAVNKATDSFTLQTLIFNGGAPTSVVYRMDISADGKYLALGLSGSIRLYSITYSASNNTVTLNPVNAGLAIIPAGILAPTFHPDSKHFAVGFTTANGSDAPYVYKIANDSSSFDQIAKFFPDLSAAGYAPMVSWSADGTKAMYQDSNATVYSFDVNITTEKTTLNAALTKWSASSIQGCALSPDGTILQVGGNSSPYMALFSVQVKTTALTALQQPQTLPTAASRGSVWSRDNKYLFVATSSAPWVMVFKRVGANLTLLTSPFIGTALSVEARYGDVSKNGKYYAVALQSSPGVAIFTINGDDTFTRLTTLPSLTGASSGLFFSDDSAHLSIAINVSPYLEIWSVNSTTNTFTKVALTINGGAISSSILNPRFNPQKTALIAPSSTSATMIVFAVASISTTACTLTRLSAGSPTPFTMTGLGTFVAWHPNGIHFAMGGATAGRAIVVNKLAADGLSYIGIATQPPQPNVTGGVWGVSWSEDGKRLYVGTNELAAAQPGTIHTYDFDVTNEFWQELAYPDIPIVGQVSDLRISPDGRYLALTSEVSPFFRWYKTGLVAISTSSIASAPFIKNQALITSQPTSLLSGVAASSDASFVVTFGNNQVRWFYKAASGLIVSGGFNSTTGNSSQGDMTGDGMYIAQPRATSPFLQIFKKTGTIASPSLLYTLSSSSNIPAQPSAPADFAKWSKDGNYLVVGNNTDFILYRKNSDDTLTVIPRAAGSAAPTGRCYAGVFSSSGKYFFVGQVISNANSTTGVMQFVIADDGASYTSVVVPAMVSSQVHGLDYNRSILVVANYSSTETISVYTMSNGLLTYQAGMVTGGPAGNITAVRLSRDASTLFALNSTTGSLERYNYNQATNKFEYQQTSIDLPVLNGGVAGLALTDDSTTLLVASGLATFLTAYQANLGSIGYPSYSAGSTVFQRVNVSMQGAEVYPKFGVASRMNLGISPKLVYPQFSTPGFVKVPVVAKGNLAYSTYSLASNAGVFPKEYPDDTAIYYHAPIMVEFTKSTISQTVPFMPFGYSDIVYPYFGMINVVAEHIKTTGFKLTYGPYVLKGLSGEIEVNPKDAQEHDQPPFYYQNFKVAGDFLNNERVTVADLQYPFFLMQARTKNFYSVNRHNEVPFGYGPYSASARLGIRSQTDIKYPAFTSAVYLVPTVLGDLVYPDYGAQVFAGGPIAHVDFTYAGMEVFGGISDEYATGDLVFPSLVTNGLIALNRIVLLDYLYPAYAVNGTGTNPIVVNVDDHVYDFSQYVLTALAGVDFKMEFNLVYPGFKNNIKINYTTTIDMDLRYSPYVLEADSGKPVVVKYPSDIAYPLFGVASTLDNYYGVSGVKSVKFKLSTDISLLRSPRNLVVIESV